MRHSQTVKRVPVIPPVAILDNGSYTTLVIDTLGFAYAVVLVMLGATDIAMAALKLQESDQSGAGFVDVAGANFAVNGTLPSATDDNTIVAIRVDCRGGRKRYLKLVATNGDGAVGTFATAWAELSLGSIVPSSAAERGLAQELSV